MHITNAVTARICTPLWKKFLNSCIPFCCSCHIAAVYALKPPYYNTCADLKGGGVSKGRGGGGGVSLPPV